MTLPEGATALVGNWTEKEKEEVAGLAKKNKKDRRFYKTIIRKLNKYSESTNKENILHQSDFTKVAEAIIKDLKNTIGETYSTYAFPCMNNSFAFKRIKELEISIELLMRFLKERTQ